MRIDKNIPLPMMNHKAKGKKSTTISLISTMEYGDSILFKTRRRANYFAVQVRYYLKTRNKSGRACVRTVENGFRVWLLNKNKEEGKYSHIFQSLHSVPSQ